MTSKDCYKGYMGHATERYWVNAITIERESMRVPVNPNDNSDSWTHRFTYDMKVNYKRG